MQTLEELKKQRAEIDAQIKELEAAAIKEIEARAAQLGYSLLKTNGHTIAYRDQEGHTWSGSKKGRKPKWVQAIIDDGGNIEEYRT